MGDKEDTKSPKAEASSMLTGIRKNLKKRVLKRQDAVVLEEAEEVITNVKEGLKEKIEIEKNKNVKVTGMLTGIKKDLKKRVLKRQDAIELDSDGHKSDLNDG